MGLGQKWPLEQILELLDSHAFAYHTLALWDPPVWANIDEVAAAKNDPNHPKKGVDMTPIL